MGTGKWECGGGRRGRQGGSVSLSLFSPLYKTRLGSLQLHYYCHGMWRMESVRSPQVISTDCLEERRSVLWVGVGRNLPR